VQEVFFTGGNEAVDPCTSLITSVVELSASVVKKIFSILKRILSPADRKRFFTGGKEAYCFVVKFNRANEDST